MVQEYLSTLISRFPGLELSIKRLHRQDAEFRSICEDLETADIARAHWNDRGMPERADEYQKLFEQLLDEFTEYLSRKTSDLFVRQIKQGEKNSDRNT